MSFYIQLDEQAACKVGASSRIDGDSNHIVKITQAIWGRNNNGVEFLTLSLENQEKASIDLPLYYRNGEGDTLPFYNMIQAIIKLTGVAGLTQSNGTYSEYDFEAGRRIEKQGLVAIELVGKFIGAIFSKDYYRNNAGEQKYRTQLFSVYHAKTMQWARQMIAGEQALPGQIDQMLERAKIASEKSLAKIEQTSQRSYAQPQNNGFTPSPLTSMQREPQGYQNQAPQGFAPQQQGFAVNPTQNINNDDIPF